MSFVRPTLEDYIALAATAGREIMAVRAEGFETLDKLDGSPVTLADHRAEAVIEAGLAKLAPNVPMIGEEGVAEGRVPDPGELFFCVDPLDGTRDFVAKGNEFTVNIALVENGVPVQGVVFAPALGELFAGEIALDGSTRAFKTKYQIEQLKPLGSPAPIRVSPSTGHWRVIGSRRSGSKESMVAFCNALGANVQPAASSSIKFCRIAEGAADLYPRFGEVSEWDAAAGHAVLTAAGGGLMSLEGKALQYGRRQEAFLIHGFVAYGSAESANAARGALAR